MGGEIGVRSQEGIGSTFWFTSQFQKQARVLQTPDTGKFADITGSKILVVDDNATNRKLMNTLLDHWGCRNEGAADGEAGLALLREAAHNGDPFQIALLDHEMPGMDGLELGRRIKADPIIEKTLLIMVTSLGRRGDAAVLKQIGFAGYLTKPVRKSLLQNCVALVLGRADQAANDSHEPQDIITRHTIAEADKQQVRILLAEDNVINQKVAQQILKALGYKADVVANGLEAVRALEIIKYDLVLMDCMMPEMDGFEATAMIRNPESSVLNHTVVIIAMTANAMSDDQKKCIESGMNDYLSKPVKKADLGAMIEKWFFRDASTISE
jgi:CheY-like chemotaxis protein